VNSLEMMKYSALMAVMLADLGRHPDRSINRAILEDILGKLKAAETIKSTNVISEMLPRLACKPDVSFVVN